MLLPINLAFTLAVSVGAQGEAVGVNFVGGSTVNGMPQPLGSQEVAGFVPQRFWNNAHGAAGTINPKGDGGGETALIYPGFTVTWTDNFGIRSTPIADAGGNSRLLKGYLNCDDTVSGKIVVTVNGVPASLVNSGYAVIVYCDGDNQDANRVGKFTLIATDYGTKTVFALDRAQTNFDGTFTRVPNSSTTDRGAATPAGNVIIFTGLQAAGFRLEVNGASSDDFNSRAALNAIQLVDQASLPTPPEPVITSAETATGVVDSSFRYQITAENNPTSFDATGLPPGLVINQQTGLISGVPSAAGTFHVILSATNSAGTASTVLVLTIKPNDFTTQREELGATNRLETVSLLNADQIGVAGGDGVVLLSNDGGGLWDRAETGFTNRIRAIRFVGPFLFVAGDGGLLAWSVDRGRSWTRLETHTEADFNGLTFRDPFFGFVVGSGGTICFFDGQRWTPQDSGTSVRFFGVYAVGNTAYAVGEAGTICRFDGTRWVPQNSGTTTVTFHDVVFLDENFGYVVGAGGTICRTTDGGQTWTPLSTGTTATLRGIRIGDRSTAWAVGDNGTILLTTDGGDGWWTFSFGFTGTLFGLDFRDGRGVIVGEGGVCFVFGYLGFPVNHAPTVELIQPSDGAVVTPCSRLTLGTVTSDLDGFVVKVEFFRSSTKIGEASQSPFTADWHSDVLGEHTLMARATDNLGAVAWSAPLTLTVLPPERAELHEPAMLAPKAFGFCLTGPTGAYLIQTSTNLFDWRDWTTVTNETGFVHVIDPDVAGISRQFYRAQSVP